MAAENEIVGTSVASPEPASTGKIADPVESLKADLRSWGFGLIVLGFIHLLLSEFLDPVWGIVIIGVGALNLLALGRGMFIVNGLALLVVGISNIAGGGHWTLFGIMQLVWGAQEMAKYSKFGPAAKQTPANTTLAA